MICQCGTEFTPTRKNQKHCTPDCYKKTRKAYQLAYFHAHKKRNSKEPCMMCGKRKCKEKYQICKQCKDTDVYKDCSSMETSQLYF
jgi:hypothetical protein